jgi:uncharacterized protein (TIGR02569 family)
MRPPVAVLDALGLRDEPRLLEGGQGRTWRVGDLVVKPVDNPAEHDWTCEVYAGWSHDEVAVPRAVPVGDGWSVAGWAAYAYLPGRSARAGDDPAWFRHVHEVFHDAVADLPRPDFLDYRDDSWAYGDRVAWEGAAPQGSAETREVLARALSRLEVVELPAQVVHGDLGGNVLRDGDRAAVIDWPPYWRPAGFALAVAALDAVCWEDADEALLDRWADVACWDQLLLRAVVYRMATRGHNEQVGVTPAGSEGYAVERRALRLVERRLG